MNITILKKLKKINNNNNNNNNKGYSTIQVAILSMIVIIALCGLIDISKILIKFNSISSSSTYIAEVVSNQGGLLINKPTYITSDYKTSGEILSDITENLSYSGISSSDFTIYIDNLAINSSSYPGVQKDYGNPITVRVDVTYTFPLLSNFIPPLKNSTFKVSSNRNTISMFKIRNNTNLDTTY